MFQPTVSRDARPEGSEPDREPPGSGAGDAVAALQGATAWTGRQVREAAADAAAPPDYSGGPDRGGLLPEDHREHAHGEGVVRHVQELRRYMAYLFDVRVIM